MYEYSMQVQRMRRGHLWIEQSAEGLAVNGLRESHDGVGEHVRYQPESRVTIDACVLEIDTGLHAQEKRWEEREGWMRRRI
jgi:hypothetical protein